MLGGKLSDLYRNLTTRKGIHLLVTSRNFGSRTYVSLCCLYSTRPYFIMLKRSIITVQFLFIFNYLVYINYTAQLLPRKHFIFPN